MVRRIFRPNNRQEMMVLARFGGNKGMASQVDRLYMSMTTGAR